MTDPMPYDPTLAGVEPVPEVQPKPKRDPRFAGYGNHVETLRHGPAKPKGIISGGPSRLPLKLSTGETVDAASLRLWALRSELERAGLQGMTGEMGKAALLDLYAAHLAAEAEAQLPAPGQPFAGSARLARKA